MSSNFDEDDDSNLQAEENLLNSRNSSETVISTDTDIKNKSPTSCCYWEARKTKYVSWCYLSLIFISLIWAICTIIWPTYNLVMQERLRMRPGLPPYNWWQDPPEMVQFQVYIFNVTNSEQYLQNNSVKLHMEEIGPLTFLEKLTHSNITFNENGTLSYLATRKAIFLPELNTIDLNSTVIVPNWAVLGVASYLWEQSFFIKLGYNLLVRSTKPQVFVNITINDLLWNFTDPFLEASKKISPFLVPTSNMGILSRIYTRFKNTLTVYIGTKHGDEKFFLIDKYDGSENLPYWGDSCGDKVVNSTEGIVYPQHLTKNTTINYLRLTLCKTAKLIYNDTRAKSGIQAYHFVLPDDAFNRTQPESADCYTMSPKLPDGLSDISKCHYGFPMATSFPHFLHGDEILKKQVTGLKPNYSAHSSFVTVEPLTGIPLISRAASQCNLVVRKLQGFHEATARFSNTVIPMFWLEYRQIGLPWYITAMIYFTANILPTFSYLLPIFLFLWSLFFIRLYLKTKHKKQLLINKIIIFEKERDLLINNKA